jgi:predicted DNA-binding transcriptional regulator AlpA
MNEQLRLFRFANLKALGVVSSWPQVKRLVDKHDFPPGFLLSPGIRVWTEEEITNWVNRRRAAALGELQETFEPSEENSGEETQCLPSPVVRRPPRSRDAKRASVASGRASRSPEVA